MFIFLFHDTYLRGCMNEYATESMFCKKNKNCELPNLGKIINGYIIILTKDKVCIAYKTIF